MNGTPNAVIYIRVSTAKQEAEGVSLDAQLAKAEAWALANDYEVAGVHKDAISGKFAEDRPGFQAAMEQACAIQGALVVYSLSRFARSTKETIELADELERAGADLVSLSEHIETTTAAGKMIFRMLAVLAEFERDQIAERTSMAMQQMRRDGKYTGGRVRYGYRPGPDGLLVEHVDEQLAIAIARDLHAAGSGLRAIARALAAEGHLSRNGKPMQATQVKRILADAPAIQAAA